jgi:hypothetical protein
MSKLTEFFKTRRKLGIETYDRPLGTDVDNLEAMEAEELADLIAYREARLLKKAGIVVDDIWQHIIDKGPRPDDFTEVILNELIELLN